MSRILFTFLVLILTLVPAAARADVVSDWVELQSTVHKATEDPMGSFDADRFHAYSRVALAMFEAANAVRPTYQSYLKLQPAAQEASEVAAVSAAAQKVLLKI